MAHDNVAENLNLAGRLYYNASTIICVPTSLDQEVGGLVDGNLLRAGHMLG